MKDYMNGVLPIDRCSRSDQHVQYLCSCSCSLSAELRQLCL